MFLSAYDKETEREGEGERDMSRSCTYRNTIVNYSLIMAEHKCEHSECD